jgi:hypothetical protein
MHRSAAARFAGAVAARHGGATRRSSIAMVFRRAERRMRTGVGRRIVLAPHLHFTLVSAMGTATPGAAEQRRSAHAYETPRTATAPSAALMVQRAAARAIRADGSGQAARGSHAAPPAAEIGTGRQLVARSAPPVDRVLRRAEASDSAAARDDGWGAPARQAAMAPRLELTSVEVGRLTDHIVHTIDRRIAAFRERHGRV